MGLPLGDLYLNCISGMDAPVIRSSYRAKSLADGGVLRVAYAFRAFSVLVYFLGIDLVC